MIPPSQFRTFCEERKGESGSNCKIAPPAKLDHPLRVSRARFPRPEDPWPQRMYVLSLIDAKIANGTPIEEIAKALELGTTYSLETGYRYNYDRIPHRKTVELMAKYFKVPATAIYEASPEDKGELALAREFITGAIGSEASSMVQDEKAVAAYRAAVASLKAVLA